MGVKYFIYRDEDGILQVAIRSNSLYESDKIPYILETGSKKSKSYNFRGISSGTIISKLNLADENERQETFKKICIVINYVLNVGKGNFNPKNLESKLKESDLENVWKPYTTFKKAVFLTILWIMKNH